MPQPTSMAPRIAPLWRNGLAPAQRQCCAARASSAVLAAARPNSRAYASISKSKVVRMTEGRHKQKRKPATKPMSYSEQEQKAQGDFFRRRGPPFIPGTFVPLPLSEQSLNPRKFLVYSWWRLRTWAVQLLKHANYKMASMPSWKTRPQLKIRRGQIAPTAKALHREVMEAFAAGDKRTIERLCYGDFAGRLTSAIDRRNPNEVTHFQIRSYDKRLLYPRLCSNTLEKIPDMGPNTIVQQAVVAIASTQQASRSDRATGKALQGSLKLQGKTEYVVVTRIIDEKTWESSEWKLWGTTGPSSFEGFQETVRAMEAQSAEMLGVRKDSKTS